MKNCYEIGTIQAFLDGELSSAPAEKFLRHCAECDTCGLLLRVSEEENSFVFDAMDSEIDTLVPTERLRAKVFASIAEIERNEKPYGFIGFPKLNFFLNPSFSFAVMIVLFICAGAAAVGYLPLFAENESEIAANQRTIVVEKNGAGSPAEVVPTQKFVVPPSETAAATGYRIVENKRTIPYAPQNVSGGNSSRTYALRASYLPEGTPRKRIPRRIGRGTLDSSLPMESQFVTTIDSLNSSLDENKGRLLSTKERIKFEKNLALIDDSIAKMKSEVKKNPKSVTARELLSSSYQNKIDLLNSVNERSELMSIFR